jgi:hypothetical protein
MRAMLASLTRVRSISAVVLLVGLSLVLGGCDEKRPAASGGGDGASAADAAAPARTAVDASRPPPEPAMPPPPAPPGEPPTGAGAGPEADGGPGAGTMKAGLPLINLEPVAETRRVASARALAEARQLARGQGPGAMGPLRLAVFANPGNIEAWYEMQSSLKLTGNADNAEQAWDILFQLKQAGCLRCLVLVRQAAHDPAWADRKDDEKFRRLTDVETVSSPLHAGGKLLAGKPGQPLVVPAQLLGATAKVTLARRGAEAKTEELTGAAALNQALARAGTRGRPHTQVACDKRCCLLLADPPPTNAPPPTGTRPTRACFEVPAGGKGQPELRRLDIGPSDGGGKH